MVYLDNNSTTKIDQRVYHKQCEVLNKLYGNPSSLYPLGVVAKELVSNSRKQVASFINADISHGDQILFTSCATESNNSVLHSVLQPTPNKRHIIISAVEHPSIVEPSTYYESIGCEVTRVPVNSDGVLDEKHLLSSITSKTVLVSIGLVNSETGIIQDVSGVAKKVKEIRKEVIIHTDAVQAAGKIPIDVKALNIDFLSLSGHKFHAPKGVGVLFIKSGVPFYPFMLGGHQEFNMRAGTENTASVVAIGEATIIANNTFKSGSIQRIAALRDFLEQELLKTFPSCLIIGKNAPRVNNTTNVGFRDVSGDKLVLQLAKRNIFVSSGTACNSENAEPSSVLRAMNVPDSYIRSIRISLSRETMEADIQALLDALKDIIKS